MKWLMRKRKSKSLPRKPNKSRRSFLNILLESSLVGFITTVLYPVIRYLIPPKVADAQG